jgi:organic hydroperoxide reductase OsmC/OhrA
MSEYRVRVEWDRDTPDFTYETYGRAHRWEFPGGQTVRASGAPEFGGDAALANPEEAFAAALSSCHMLTFLALAARRRLTVDRYTDEATAIMEKNAEGRMAVTKAILRPRVEFGGDKTPDADQLKELHRKAHELCFIANSVRTDVTIET